MGLKSQGTQGEMKNGGKKDRGGESPTELRKRGEKKHRGSEEEKNLS